MKFLFTAPRFHTNQVPIVKGLIEKGHEVRYFVTFIGATENHTDCEPLVLKPSRYTVREQKRLTGKISASDVESVFGRKFIPDFSFLKQAFSTYMPDVVICREKTNLTQCVYALCREYQIPCVLYDQDPYYPMKSGTGMDIKDQMKPSAFSILKKRIEKRIDGDLKRIYRFRETVGFPVMRMTPVEYKMLPRSLSLSTPSDHTFYIPFVAEAHPEALQRDYCNNGIIRFLCVGKFREYKNVKLIVQAASLLDKNKPWSVTLIGQAYNSDEKQYLEDVRRMLLDLKLSESFEIKTNVPHQEIGKEYMRHDVFILPSRRELASIAVLEAMSYGLPVISTNCNGTASYITERENGLIFESENPHSLAERMEELMHADIRAAGIKALQQVKMNHSFESYYDRFMRLCHEVEHFSADTISNVHPKMR